MKIPHLTPNVIGDGILTDARGDLVADCYTIDQPEAKAIQVAEEVAMRCNNHNELVAALRELSSAYTELTRLPACRANAILAEVDGR